MREEILALGCEGIAPLVRMAFAPCGMTVVFVPPEALGLTLGALAESESPPCAGGRGETLAEPMLVFCGFSDARMDQALSAMRRAGLHIPCKAMLTAKNRAWKPARLLAELRREHTALGGR